MLNSHHSDFISESSIMLNSRHSEFISESTITTFLDAESILNQVEDMVQQFFINPPAPFAKGEPIIPWRRDYRD